MQSKHILPTPSSSVIVATTAAVALGEMQATVSPDEQELRAKPRGFFADQFEVCPNFSQLQ